MYVCVRGDVNGHTVNCSLLSKVSLKGKRHMTETILTVSRNICIRDHIGSGFQ